MVKSNNNPSTSTSNTNAAAPQPFKKRKLTKTQSKFELHGDDVIAFLHHSHKTNDKRIHWFQREAVFFTSGRLEEDRGKWRRGGLRNPAVKPIIIVAPTGSGKSGMIAMLPYVLKSKKVLVLTPSKVIREQLAEAIGNSERSFYSKSGISTDIADETSNPNDLLEIPIIIRSNSDVTEDMDIASNLVIVNAQKFGGKSGMSLVHENQNVVENARRFFSRFDTLLVDEAHHFTAITWKNIVKAFSHHVEGMDKKLVFLTATPYRVIKKEAKFIFGEDAIPENRVFTIKPKDLIGTIIRPSDFYEMEYNSTVAQPISEAEAAKKEVRKVSKDRHGNLGVDKKGKEDDLAQAERNAQNHLLHQVTHDIVTKLEEQFEDEPRFQPQALIIVKEKNEAKLTAKALNEVKGDKFAVAIVSDNQSDEMTKAFTGGEYRVGVICGLLKEGYDNPKITLCVILRKIGSRITFSQFIGRSFRMNRDIEDSAALADGSRAIVLSYKKYGQQKMWDEKDMMATRDPTARDD